MQNTYYIHKSAPVCPLRTRRKTCIQIWCQQLRTCTKTQQKQGWLWPRSTNISDALNLVSPQREAPQFGLSDVFLCDEHFSPCSQDYRLAPSFAWLVRTSRVRLHGEVGKLRLLCWEEQLTEAVRKYSHGRKCWHTLNFFFPENEAFLQENYCNYKFCCKCLFPLCVLDQHKKTEGKKKR